MRLLVAVNGRPGGQDASELARVLGSLEPSSVLVITVLYAGVAEFGLSPEEEHEADPLFEEARAVLAGIAVETQAYGGGSPARIIDGIVGRGRFDAVIVGSPHRGPIGRVLIGSVAANLLSGSEIAVAVAPVDYSNEVHEAPRTIAVGYDGTPEAKLALRRAEAIARLAGAELKLITVVSRPSAVPAMVPMFASQVPRHPDEVIDSAIATVDEDLEADGVRLDGDPAAELVRRCEEGVDLLILGSRGYGPAARVLLGSVSRAVTGHAPCPVMVVPRH